MKEDGLNSGARSIGRLALAMIPWALGIGASVWLGVWIGVHQFRHELSQEKRAAQYVGAAERPKSKMALVIVPRDCTHIIRADIDGSALMLYSQNDCHERLRYDYMEWHWQVLSPDKTVLKEGYENWRCGTPLEPGDKAECRVNIGTDDRAATLRVWTQQ